jgi:glutathione peroxidase
LRRFVMKGLLAGVAAAAVVLAIGGRGSAEEKKGGTKMAGPLDYKLPGIDGKEVDLGQYKGKVVLLVNVASECGYTPQYQGLEELYEKYKDAGLVVVGVPSNEFGKQEPGSNADILKFCKSKYNVTFPMLGKVVVKGDGQVPLYQLLTDHDKKPVGWNFEKFLVNRKGEVAGRFKSGVEPNSEALTAAIKKELDAK